MPDRIIPLTGACARRQSERGRVAAVRRGVVPDLPQIMGTGAGTVLQDMTELEF